MLSNTSRSSKFAARYSPTDRRRVGYTKLGRRVNLATVTALSSFLDSAAQLPHHGATLQYHAGCSSSEAPRTCRCQWYPAMDQSLPACFCWIFVHQPHKINTGKEARYGNRDGPRDRRSGEKVPRTLHQRNTYQTAGDFVLGGCSQFEPTWQSDGRSCHHVNMEIIRLYRISRRCRPAESYRPPAGTRGQGRAHMGLDEPRVSEAC